MPINRGILLGNHFGSATSGARDDIDRGAITGKRGAADGLHGTITTRSVSNLTDPFMFVSLRSCHMSHISSVAHDARLDTCIWPNGGFRE